MDFVAIDIETSNPDMASICQIGIAEYKDGKLVNEWNSYLNPEDYFDEINIDIHGITEDMVADAPNFSTLYDEISSLLSGKIAVCHTHFDRTSLKRAINKYSLDEIDVVWLDSARVARRAWSQYAYKGYGLSNICNDLGYEFKHHDALEDAKAAAFVLLSAIDEKGLDLDDWIVRVDKPINLDAGSYSDQISKDGNPEGHLYGNVLVFTGSLNLPRKEASELAAKAGCKVVTAVTKKTSLLVVGDQDLSRLAGHVKSGKHRKAEELAKQGQNIRIIKESDFMKLCAGN
jgi:DNA polymerase-3 subunit epsilon